MLSLVSTPRIRACYSMPAKKIAKREVVFYCGAEALRTSASGARMRVVSNLRAYAALGVRLRLVLFSGSTAAELVIPELGDAVTEHVTTVVSEEGVAGKVLYRLGLAHPAAVRYMFPMAADVYGAARRYHRDHPEAIHHFEGEDVAVAVLLGQVPRSIWSFHDMPSAVSRASAEIGQQLEGREIRRSELREVRFMRNLERRLARRAELILTISELDCAVLRGWGVDNVDTLPFSVEYEPAGTLYSPGSGRLRLLHLGRIAHMPSYRSLEFLMEEVLPRLDPSTRRQVELLVVGTATGSDPRTLRIRQLAAQYPDVVQLCGYVRDLATLYGEVDAQVVASTQATGARTRVVESFAHGVPVISTSIAAAGIRGLRPGENILIADKPDEWADLISRLVSERSGLADVGRHGRAAYDREHSPRVVASALRAAVERHMSIAL